VRPEQAIIDRIRAKSGPSRLALGIGDDCAIFRPKSKSEELVFTTDMFIEDVHFRRETHTPAQVGYKALARGLSDIAAMGAEPRFCLLSVAFPKWATDQWIDRFFDGLLALARETGTELAGGDLSHAAVFASDIVVCGSAPTGTALRRSGAKPGDSIYVSGAVGGSALGLAAVLSRDRQGAVPQRTAWKRHVHPEPRLALGRHLRGKASAAMDVSDGLALDLHRLCQASNVSAEIEAPPIFKGATLDQALYGGEDYELLFTARPDKRFPKSLTGVPITRIGQIKRGNPGQIKLNGEALAIKGYDHFAQ
jgi:thiamine-monophosphate kinase